MRLVAKCISDDCLKVKIASVLVTIIKYETGVEWFFSFIQ